jgi:hypothetical protein
LIGCNSVNSPEAAKRWKARAYEILGWTNKNDDAMVYKTHYPRSDELPTMAAEVPGNSGVFTPEQRCAIQERLEEFADILGEEVGKIQRELERRWQAKFQALENKMLQAENLRLRDALDRRNDAVTTEFDFGEAKLATRN